MIAANVLQLIGNTPLVKLNRFDTGTCELFLKLESANPGGSIKDRIALSMIEAAEKSGALKPGGMLVEATAGNTGLALALVASQKGYPLTLVIPDKMSLEKVQHLKALGAKIIMTRSDVGKGHPDYYQEKAERMAREIPGAFYVNQFENPANPAAHERTTGPELMQEMDGKIDAVVVGVGSGGTLTGLGRYFKTHAPQTEMVLADPAGSILAPLVNTGKTVEAGSWLVEGIGEDFVPKNCDLSLVKKAYTVSDRESIGMAREMLMRNGILCGPSTGTLITAALWYCQEQTTAKRVVTFVCDTGAKYLSKMFNPEWLEKNNLNLGKGSP
jgi:cystathionine beta-synthase